MADGSTFLYNMPPESADTITEITNQTNDEPASQDAPQSTASAADASRLPIQGEEFRFGNMVFTSKFDSGNLQKVEKVNKDQSTSDKVGYLDPVADIEYNVWTRPDCAGGPYENGNRSWFYFGIRGYTPGKQIRINIMNMNKQGKLYSQGHSPIYRILPQRPNWERIKDRCSFENVGQDFILTFYYRFPEFRGTVYFSFCYPWSYTESLQQMDSLDSKYADADENIKNRPDNDIYYHRELFSRSLDGLRIDLLTISSYKGISEKREPKYDPQLFPDKTSVRCRNFSGKRVFVCTSRVHPGESPASFVYNGFLEFILRPNDKRAIQLRDQYVFKLIPMLNPDGVVRGHYRTDSRGINLNRLYLDPVNELYPSIYAAKSLLVFHHVNNCPKRKDYIPNMSVIFQELAYLKKSKSRSDSAEPSGSPPSMTLESVTDCTSPRSFSAVSLRSGRVSKEPDINSEDKGGTHFNRCSSADSNLNIPHISEAQCKGTEHLNHPRLRLIPHDESGIAFYVDLHGHASKRGCFMYGNHFMDEERALLNLLYPKLISMNSAHFDYGGCNFTEKNMYTKDRRDGHSKEGSGRVATHKSIGIVHCYTLECNYNSGRLVNSIASTPDGRITPPPIAGFPPKFTQAHFEEVGRAMAIAAIDYTDTNPLSRLQYSELNSVHAVKDWIRRTLRGGKGVAKYNRPSISINPKTMTRSTGTFHTVKSEPIMRPRQHINNNINADGTKTGFSFGRTPRFSEGDLHIQNSGNTNSSTPKQTDLAPVREAPRRSFSLPSPTVLLKSSNNKATASKNLGEVNQTRSYSLRLMHTMSRQNNTTVQILQTKKLQNGGISVGSSSAEKKSAVENHSEAENTDSRLIGTEPESLVSEPTGLLRVGTLANIEPTTLKTSDFPVPKPGNVSKEMTTKKIRKRSNNLGPHPVVDQAKELGVALERTTLKSNKRRSSGKKFKTKIPGPNVQVNCMDRVVTQNGLLQGANIKLADRSKEVVEKACAADSLKNAEMDNFERELRQRMSSLKHPEAYWVEL